MENESLPPDRSQVPVEVPESAFPKQSGWKIWFFVILFILIATLTAGVYFYFNNYSSPKSQASQVTTQTQPEVSPQASGVPASSDNWATTPKNFMGTYTFQYPAGWHIANQWPTNDTDGITVFLDPNPLNFAPRGGPISALRITDTSGKPNPDELFSSEKDKYKASLTDEKDEVINTSFGPVYHYWGKINVYMEMVNTEGYFFQLQGGVNDLINKHNIFATTDTNAKYSDILRKIVLSFKKTQ